MIFKKFFEYHHKNYRNFITGSQNNGAAAKFKKYIYALERIWVYISQIFYEKSAKYKPISQAMVELIFYVI